MFLVLVISIYVLEVLATHVDPMVGKFVVSFWQIEAMLLMLLAVFAESTQRDKSVLLVLSIWFGWIAITDLWPEYISAPVAGLETSIFSFFVLWAMARPYFYSSFPLESRGENILIGFYRGTKAPLLSSLSALIGLPFSSIVIVGGVTALRPSAFGEMTINHPDILNPDDYVFINTGVKATPGICAEIAKCSGKPTRLLGIFSAKCVRTCQPVLEMLGLKPKSWFHYMPSIFYYQAAKGV